jgi:hypothetical protein
MYGNLGNKGQWLIIWALLIVIALFAIRPVPSLEIHRERGGEQVSLDDFEREASEALNVVYFNSSLEKMLEWILFEKELLKAKRLNLQGYFFLSVPERKFLLGNFFDDPIYGEVNISGEVFPVNINSSSSYLDNFTSFGLVSIGLTTPAGPVYAEFNITKRPDIYIDTWLIQKV